MAARGFSQWCETPGFGALDDPELVRKFAEIAREEGVPTFHIETADELTADALDKIHTVGITAGASTPHSEATVWNSDSVERRS